MNENRFVISVNNGEVVILDTNNESGTNLLLLSLEFGDELDAQYVSKELYTIVRLLNEQDKLLNR